MAAQLKHTRSPRGKFAAVTTQNLKLIQDGSRIKSALATIRAQTQTQCLMETNLQASHQNNCVIIIPTTGGH